MVLSTGLAGQCLIKLFFFPPFAVPKEVNGLGPERVGLVKSVNQARVRLLLNWIGVGWEVGGGPRSPRCQFKGLKSLLASCRAPGCQAGAAAPESHTATPQLSVSPLELPPSTCLPPPVSSSQNPPVPSGSTLRPMASFLGFPSSRAGERNECD